MPVLGFDCDDVFSIGTRLEHARIVGPIRCLWTLGSSTVRPEKFQFLE